MFTAMFGHAVCIAVGFAAVNLVVTPLLEEYSALRTGGEPKIHQQVCTDRAYRSSGEQRQAQPDS
jgi:hypothetical protein